MDQNYIAPAAALKKLKTARSLPQTVYLYGATGYGKTELVRQYLSDRRYTYLSCEELPWEAGALPSEESDRQRRVVVIDDLHRLKNEELRREILALEEREDIWLILISRSPIPAWLMPQHIKSVFVVISEKDLRMGRKEIAAYLDARGITWTEEDMQLLQVTAEGNAYVLHHVAWRMKEGLSPGPELHAEIWDAFAVYLENVVLVRWDSDLLEFLMQISVVDEFTLELAEMISGNLHVTALLEQAAEAGNFLTQEDGVYRLRPVLIDALRNRALKIYGRERVKDFKYNAALLQSGTDLTSEAKVLTYNGDTLTTTFTAGDTIKVVATPTATGAAPTNSAMFAASFTAPGAGQMAVFVDDTQVSEPVDAVDGTYTMEVSAADVLLAAGGPGTEIPLTAKFVENDNMAGAEGTVKVSISAVARVEKDSTTSYVDKNGLNTVFAYNSGYEDATVTLLDDMTITDAGNRPQINIRCTLNLNGHTIRSDTVGAPPLEVSGYGNVTIAGSGEIVSNSGAALYVVGTAVLEGGIFRSGGTYQGAVEVMNGSLSVTGENVVMENTGSGNGLLIYSLESVKLSAGKYTGAAGAISVSTDVFTLSSLLNQEGTSRVAYYQDNATLVTEGLDGQTLSSGSYTVRACTHAYQYTHTTGATTHSQTCPACGDAKAAETCSYDAATGRCACGSTLAVTLPADLCMKFSEK